MEDSLLSLRWNNHRSTFLHTLANLHGKEYCSDATVACDGKLYPVHKIVLSTCSDYFEAMMNMTHQSQHPFIVLKDVRQEDLEALLSYMYIGEVQVSQGDLAALLKAAECLRIKGLAVPDEEPKSNENKRPASDDKHHSTSASKRCKNEVNSDSNEGSRFAVTTETPQSSPSTPVAPCNPPSTSSTPEKSVAGGDTQNTETSDAVEQEQREETQSEEFRGAEIPMTQGSSTRQENEEGEQYTLMKEERASVKEEPFDDMLLQQHIASLPSVHITNNTVNQNDGMYSQMLGVKQDGAMVWDNRPPPTQEYSISASTSSTSTDFSHNRPLPFPQPHQIQHGIKDDETKTQLVLPVCVFCLKVCNDGSETVTLREKGSRGVNLASIERGDVIRVTAGQKVHIKCRKTYTGNVAIKNLQKRMKEEAFINTLPGPGAPV